MVTKKSNAAVVARQKAREAKARLDAQRAQRDKRMLDATTAYYAAGAQIEQGRELVAAGESATRAALLDLAAVGLTHEEIADLTGLGVSAVAGELREAKKNAAAVPEPEPTQGEAEREHGGEHH